ncbi:MAG TPA: hypothetical protein PKV71_05285 [Calditrichia bacterium]|nr:hypothetical protein [Calditrichota bacterium]HQU71007.1 hypothetical protein [Calditrichia bacterium]HQV31266.1 hypothetical protein [Calditrichia bacterium]
MLLPQGIEKHKNLSTSFTRFDHLLQDLFENRFSGYLKLNFWGFEGVLVFDTGRMIEGYTSEQDVYLTGEPAVLKVLEKGVEPEGTLEVYDLASEIALALGYALQATLYKDENDLGNYALTHVFEMLENEGLTGYVDLQFSGKRGNGTVYFLEGTSVEAVIMSGTGRIASGEQVFNKFLEIGELIQPRVKAYQVLNPTSINEDESFVIPWIHKPFVHFWGEILQLLRGIMDDYFKKNKFYPLLEKVCNDNTDHYPFLDPRKGIVRLSPEGFDITRIIHYPTFVQGMIIVLNKAFLQVPPRPFKKLDVALVAAEVGKMAEKVDLNRPGFDPHKTVMQIFRGFA